ncbi:helix-turn-helix domain-containing protein [Alkalihalobacillus sp. NPDC078783]
MKNRSKLLYKYIISYLLIFLVPFIVMSVVIYFNAVSSLREEIESSNIYNLEQVRNLTDDRLSELETITTRISFDPRLTPYMMNHGYYGKEAINELKKYKANSAIIEELFVYYYNDETLFSTNGLYSIDALMQNSNQLERFGKENLLMDLRTDLPLIRTVDDFEINSETHENLIVYYLPVKLNSVTPYGTAMYFIEESTLISMIQNILGDMEGNVYVFDEGGQVIASTIHDDSISAPNVISLLNNANGIDTIGINGKEYSTVSVQSGMSGWTFVTVMDPSQLFSKLSNMQYIVAFFLVSLFIVGIILAVVFGKNQYKPIRALSDIAKKGEDASFASGLYTNENELETIGRSFTTLYQHHEILNETVYLHQPFAKEQFLLRLLKGSFEYQHELAAMMDSLDISIVEGNHFVATLHFEAGSFCEENICEKDQLIQKLHEVHLNGTRVYAVDLLYSDSIAILVSTSASSTTVIDQQIAIIQTYINQYFERFPTICVGQSYSSLEKVNRSYIEALATAEYKFTKPLGSILYFKDIGETSQPLIGYFKEEQIKFVQSLKQGDVTVAHEMLGDMFQVLEQKNQSIHEIKCICFDLINTTLKTVSDIGCQDQFIDLNQLIEFKSIDDLKNQLMNIVEDICEEVERKKDSHNSKLRDELLSFIRENYTLYEISLEFVANRFYLSVSYLSRFIKEQTGVTFTQFIQDLRIQHVKNQLTQSDQPIKEIVVQVGYKDVANFIRKFKKIEGVTPGQYRKLHK